MSVIRVRRLVATSDNNFNIEMPLNAVLNIQGGLAQDANSAFKLPAGTTAERPSTPTAGTIRYNTDLRTVEGYNGAAWANLMVAENIAEVQDVLTLPTRGLVLHLDANDPKSLIPDSTAQDANYWYNLRSSNFHFGIPTDRIATTNINGNIVRYLDFSVNGVGCAKLATNGAYADVPWYPHCTVVCFLMWRNSDSQWRTLLRSRDADHQIIVQDGTRNLGMYDNNGVGFQDSGYDINQFPDWDTKFNMYTWRFSSYESGVYSPNYQCYFANESTPRGQINTSDSRYNRGFYHIGAWGSGNTNPHSSSQNVGNIAVFMYYNRHISQSDREQIYQYYRTTFDI